MKPSVAQCHQLHNTIQTYAWGSTTAIAQLLGATSPSDEPQAELWMGAHPKAPSKLTLPNGEISLLDWIKAEPSEVLGPQVVRTFQDRLPFLFKVLAAAKPLSIQAHPNKAQAELGFAKEEAAGIPFAARHRNYRDDNHKPELICALTPFWALKGFRSPEEILPLFEKYQLKGLAALAALSTQSSPQSRLSSFYEALLSMSEAAKQECIERAIKASREVEPSDMISQWIQKLSHFYPGDIGVLAPLYLHLIQLAPGEALYLGAGELHAYLEGTGIEIMANSDNVLRGGLTIKHMDVPELLSVLTFAPNTPQRLTPQPGAQPTEQVYQTPAPEFLLSCLRLSSDQSYQSPDHRHVEILLCTEGQATLQPADEESKWMPQGSVYLIPASAPAYKLSGEATVYKATVPRETPQKAHTSAL